MEFQREPQAIEHAGRGELVDLLPTQAGKHVIDHRRVRVWTFGRELAMTVFRAWAARRGVVIAAQGPGKLKTVFQSIFIGGAIAPGVGISMEALADLAQLRRVELVRPPSVIARSTVTALQSGILYGVVGQVEEIIRRMRRELGGHAIAVATGGWADLVISECRCFDHHDPLLTLDGLRIVHERNQTPDVPGAAGQEALPVQHGKDGA